MPRKGEGEQLIQSKIGIQELIYLDAFPKGLDQSDYLQGPLVGKTLSAAGVYYALICVAGLSAILITLRATLTGAGTITTDAYKTFADAFTKKGASASGVGPMVTGVAQSISIDDLLGEKYVLLKFTLVDPVSAEFTQAEVNGSPIVVP